MLEARKVQKNSKKTQAHIRRFSFSMDSIKEQKTTSFSKLPQLKASI